MTDLDIILAELWGMHVCDLGDPGDGDLDGILFAAVAAAADEFQAPVDDFDDPMPF